MRRSDLVPDCRSCAALCCVATAFDASEDFALDKPAGVGCPHLMRDCRCAIHDELAVRGFPGCAQYDCYGAGQRTTRAFAGVRDAELQRNAAFLVLRVVHELLWLMTEAARFCPATHQELAARLAREIEALDAITHGPTQALFDLDLRPHQMVVRSLLAAIGDALGGRRAKTRALVVVG